MEIKVKVDDGSIWDALCTSFLESEIEVEGRVGMADLRKHFSDRFQDVVGCLDASEIDNIFSQIFGEFLVKAPDAKGNLAALDKHVNKKDPVQVIIIENVYKRVGFLEAHDWICTKSGGEYTVAHCVIAGYMLSIAIGPQGYEVEDVEHVPFYLTPEGVEVDDSHMYTLNNIDKANVPERVKDAVAIRIFQVTRYFKETPVYLDREEI